VKTNWELFKQGNDLENLNMTQERWNYLKQNLIKKKGTLRNLSLSKKAKQSNAKSILPHNQGLAL